jgi:hypothetical protein
MNGDDDPDGLGSPAAYAKFAAELVEQGYEAINLHGWMPPYEVSPDRDVTACAAVRDAVGDDVELMFTPYHHYDRGTVRSIGRRLEELDFRWIEEPADERSWSTYESLGRDLDIPIMGAKSLDGNVRARAEWLKREITDAVRAWLETQRARGASLSDAIGELTPEAIARHLYAVDLPDPDLIIRTSGEIRMSGFLLWQSVHSEFYFTDVPWPAFRKIDLLRAVRAYQARERRFGG